jgi:hypothetical protein
MRDAEDFMCRHTRDSVCDQKLLQREYKPRDTEATRSEKREGTDS